jgi:hypothetical protein
MTIVVLPLVTSFSRTFSRFTGPIIFAAIRRVFAEQLGRGAPSRLVLEIHMGQRLPVVLACDAAGQALTSPQAPPC